LPPAQVTVVIPTLEGGENLEKCLAALSAQTLSGCEVVVVDNSGRAIAREAVRRAGARLLENPSNVGFGVAINQGFAGSSAEFLCVLNDDAFPEPRWLEALVAACRSDASVGMCASQIRLADQPGLLDSAGMQVYLDGSSKQRGHAAPADRFADREEVLFPSGCAALYRAVLFRGLGGFDPDFFLYCEDTDLGLRARRAGWRCLYVPTAVVYHRYSYSAGRASAAKAFYVERNRLFTVIKNFPLWTWPLVPLFSIFRYAMHLWGLGTGRGLAAEFSGGPQPWWKLAGIALRANVAAFGALPRMLAKRRLPSSRSRTSSWAFWRLLRRHSISAREVALQA
jgi:GT2 family glycosyltransferase